jgi:hypothetical protein
VRGASHCLPREHALNDIKYRNDSYATTWVQTLYFLEHNMEAFIRGNPCTCCNAGNSCASKYRRSSYRTASMV